MTNAASIHCIHCGKAHGWRPANNTCIDCGHQPLVDLAQASPEEIAAALKGKRRPSLGRELLLGLIAVALLVSLSFAVALAFDKGAGNLAQSDGPGYDTAVAAHRASQHITEQLGQQHGAAAPCTTQTHAFTTTSADGQLLNAAHIDLEWTIRADGGVHRLKLLHDGMGDQKLLRCLINACSNVEFATYSEPPWAYRLVTRHYWQAHPGAP